MLTALYHLHMFYEQLDFSWAIAAKSSPLHVASDQT